MKYPVMLLAIILGVILGFFPNITKPKPLYWKILLLVAMTMGIILTILPPIAGSARYAVKLAETEYSGNIAVSLQKENSELKISRNSGTPFAAINFESKGKMHTGRFYLNAKSLEKLENGNEIIIDCRFDGFESDSIVILRQNKILSVNPLIKYPFIPSLEERIKILNFHVPVAWISVIAYLISMIYSIRYLKTGNYLFDSKAASSAAAGMLYTILATVTGMIWAKENWGSYWNWDPRETSIFVLMLIYFAYFALRSSVDNRSRKAKLSSVYSIIAFFTVPFFIFILPRLSAGLHPGAKGDVNSGPVISPESGMLDSALLYSFGICMFAAAMIYFWLMNLSVRASIVSDKIDKEN